MTRIACVRLGMDLAANLESPYLRMNTNTRLQLLARVSLCICGWVKAELARLLFCARVEFRKRLARPLMFTLCCFPSPLTHRQGN
jgi:hypothetical protein